MPAVLGLDPALYASHPLHASERIWPQTNCYVDLWIEVLSALGLEPEAMLGFTAQQDFEGDQFTFFKVPLEDLERLYGLRVQELSIYDDLEAHVVEQAARGRLVLVEVDGWFLPDTRGVSYRTGHTKTTVAVDAIETAARRLTYFHNSGFFALDGADYDGIFGSPAHTRDPALLFPYVEFVKIPERFPPVDLRAEARALLHRHLARRPEQNPILAFRAAFAGHEEALASRDEPFFHQYAFNNLRQLGANHELLGSHLAWLTERGEPGLDAARIASLAIASTAKTMQFKLARAVARKRFDGLEALIDQMAACYDEMTTSLLRWTGMGEKARRAA